MEFGKTLADYQIKPKSNINCVKRNRYECGLSDDDFLLQYLTETEKASLSEQAGEAQNAGTGATGEVALSGDMWTGRWTLRSSENWSAYLKFQGVPEDKWEIATAAPDFHTYSNVTADGGFSMIHEIPAINHTLQFSAPIDGNWVPCPYKRNTAATFKGGSTPMAALPEVLWRNFWIRPEIEWKTELTGGSMVPDGFSVQFVRRLQDQNHFLMELIVNDAETGEQVVGPCYRYMERVAEEE